MECSRCRHENPPRANFCLACGAGLAPTCPTCRTDLPPGARFCSECGQPVGAPPAAQGRFTSPQAYTPKHLAEKILTSRLALEGERKQVTVLFADLKGSMELLADRDPEEARQLLDPVLERMMEAVHGYEGTVNQVMGDGIMALFGAPVAHEDHAVRACYAALRMQASVQRYAEEVHRAAGVPLHIRVGLNSGEVVVRSIGSDLRMDYTAVGQTTHVAARMEQMAMPGSILISPETLRLAEGYVAVKPMGPRPVKGLEAPIEVYEIVGAGPARSRLHATSARGLTRFVGREAELAALSQATGKAQAGQGQVVAVIGEPGVGKSRLVWEFARSQRTDGWLILEGGSASYGKATPYLPVVDLLKAYFRIEARDEATQIGEKVGGRLARLDQALLPALPVFLALLDAPVGDPRWQALDPSQRRHHTLDGVKRLLLRESQVQPVCLILEDLHWIDSETQALLDSLVDSLPTARLLLLVNYRPEYRHGWGSKSYYAQVRLDPLPPEGAEELLQALLGQDPGLQPLKRLLVERTEGNPFFLEESVRTLVETRALVGERGAYRLAKPLPAVHQVPATVQAVVAARIDRLPGEEKGLLQTAAVLGKDVPLALLQAIADLPEEALRRGVARLQAAEFLYESSLFPDLAYAFKHALIHEVAYGSLLQERRRVLHARIVEAIERLYDDRLAEQAERLGYHALRGEVWETAARYLRQAGAKAFARSANRESATYFEQALGALQRLPQTRQTLEQAIDLRSDLHAALYPLGEIERGLAYLREEEGLARQLDDQRRLARVSVSMCEYLFSAGQWVEARQTAESARAIAERLGDFPLQVWASFRLGVANLGLGNYRPAADILRTTVGWLTGDLSRERFGRSGFPAVLARSHLAWALAERGEFGEGIVHGQEALRIAEAVDHPYSLTLACFRLAYLQGVKGEFGQAVQLLERALPLSRDWNLGLALPLVTWSLGHAYGLSGRVQEGLPLVEQGLAALESIRWRGYYALALIHLGEMCLLADRLEEARGLAERALGLSRDHTARGTEAYALRLLGEIAAHRDPAGVAEAEGYFGQAMGLAETLGMPPLMGQCQHGLGALHARTGCRDRARVELSTAIDLFRSMEMTGWLPRAEAERAKVA